MPTDTSNTEFGRLLARAGIGNIACGQAYCRFEESGGVFRPLRFRHFPDNNPLPVEYDFASRTTAPGPSRASCYTCP